MKPNLSNTPYGSVVEGPVLLEAAEAPFYSASGVVNQLNSGGSLALAFLRPFQALMIASPPYRRKMLMSKIVSRQASTSWVIIRFTLRAALSLHLRSQSIHYAAHVAYLAVGRGYAAIAGAVEGAGNRLKRNVEEEGLQSALVLDGSLPGRPQRALKARQG